MGVSKRVRQGVKNISNMVIPYETLGLIFANLIFLFSQNDSFAILRVDSWWEIFFFCLLRDETISLNKSNTKADFL